MILAWSWIVAVHAALLWLYHVPETKQLLGDEGTYWRVAQQRLAGGNPTLPALWPPLYPRFVAACVRLGGGSVWLLQAVQLAVLAAVAWIARDLSIRLLDDRRIGARTGWLVLAYPPLAAFAGYVRPEVLHLALFAGVLWILAARRTRPVWVFGAGVALGLALATKSLLGPFVPVLLLPLVAEGTPRQRGVRVALAIAGMSAVLAPSAVGDWRRTGSLELASSAWFNLWVGLNDTSRRDLIQPVVGREFRIYTESAERPAERNAILRTKIADRIRERGVLATVAGQLGRQYFRLLHKDSYLTDQLPGGVVASRGGGYRRAPAWLGALLRATSVGLYAVVLVAAAAGLVLCPPAGRRWVWLVLAFLAYNAAIFLLLHVKSRFRVQVLPFLFFYAACGSDRILRALRAEAPPPSRARAFGASAAAGVALFLAFAGPLP